MPIETSTKSRGVWERAVAPTPEQMAARVHRRRRAGVIIGALAGLAYGLASQLVNPVALAGVPLYEPPFGPVGNAIASGLVGALLGAIVCFPQSAPLGIFYASLLSGVAMIVQGVARLGGLVGTSAALVASVIFSVPFAWLLVPVVALLRWAAERQADAISDDEPLLRRAVVPLLLVAGMAILGAFELIPAEGRGELRRTHEMLRAALSGQSGALTEPLRGPLMTRFPQSGDGSYELQWTRWDLDRFIELRPPGAYDQHAAVIARFSPDYVLVCLYPTPTGEPNCKNYEELPKFNAPARRDD